MASAFRALRIAQRTPTTQFLRQQPIRAPRVTFQAVRSYATPTEREARPDKPVEAAEQGSEDLAGSDPNMDPGDPAMNGNFPDPSATSALALKRQFRDPYGGPDGPWWDPQERRNYGEPVHEDNDILSIFSPDVYTHVSPGWGAVQFMTFVGAFCTMLLVVARYYPDKPSAPRTFPGGLEAELGGPKAVRARMTEDDETALDLDKN